MQRQFYSKMLLFVVLVAQIQTFLCIVGVDLKIEGDSTYFVVANQSIIENNLSVNTSSVMDAGSQKGEEMCAGNRFEALENGRQCLKKCRMGVACENTRKQCLCDGLCGWSCIKPDSSCPDLPKITNGFYSPEINTFNAKVTYECEEGYYLFGSRERTCQGDEEWSGTPVECLSEPACKNPSNIAHAKNPNQGHYMLNDKVIYSCYQGYQASGSPEAMCRFVEGNQTAWVWSGPRFKCIPKSCGDPGIMSNGRRAGESFIVASSVTYICNEGYEMIGQSRRYCQSDGLWSGQAPQCEPVTCNPTDHLENGKINYTYPLVFNSTVIYECDYGFRLIGPKKRSCGPEKKLIGQVPRCEEIDCGELGPLTNGYVKGYSSRMGDRKEFICMDGMKFVGKSNESYCLSNATWSHPLPKCLAPCLVPRVSNSIGIFVIDDPDDKQSLSIVEKKIAANESIQSIETDRSVPHGTFLDVLCEPNFEMDERVDEDGTAKAPKCDNEKWTYEPKCKPAKCRALPPNPKNGRAIISSINHGSKAYIKCLDGYALQGKNMSQCIKGQWSTVEANCTEIYCGFPGTIEHGRVLLIGHMGMYEYKQYIKRISNSRQIAYECESGYHMKDGAPNSATCLSGKWKPEGLPTCLKE